MAYQHSDQGRNTLLKRRWARKAGRLTAAFLSSAHPDPVPRPIPSSAADACLGLSSLPASSPVGHTVFTSKPLFLRLPAGPRATTPAGHSCQKSRQAN